MSHTVQDVLADAVTKACHNLTNAYESLPDDRRRWSAGGAARTAADMVAECAVLSGYTAQCLQERQWNPDFMETFLRDKAALAAQGDAALLPLLRDGAQRAADAIRALPDDALDVEIPLPWGPMSLLTLAGYPAWNMGYHEGQINFIASLLEPAG